MTLMLSCFCHPGLQAQQAELTAGGIASGNGGSADYSVGQVAYTSIGNGNGSVNQGMQQPFELFILGIDDYSDINLKMIVFPNPAQAFIKLKMETEKYVKLRYQLFDFSGKLLLNQQVSSKETNIPMKDLPPAIYFLSVSDNNLVLKSFKIIKN